MTLTVALAGDTMLGRGVAQHLADRRGPVVAPEVAEVAAEADLFVLNLECCISDRGRRWPDPAKPFFFRAPPAAADVLAELGVDCVTLANNHALDYGIDALLDTFTHLAAAGVAWVGAGPDEDAARQPAALRAAGQSLTVVGVSDHPSAFAAGPDRPGIALGAAEGPDLVSPHSGPNMTAEPIPTVRAAADTLTEAGVTLVAGHSAHVFHGVRGPVLYDLGDFVDDYAVDPHLRNDLGLLFLATMDGGRLSAVEAVPLKLDYCHTRLAVGDDGAWIRRRFCEACARLGTEAVAVNGRLRVGG
jgi:poly-gamma-glutamate capsule biosynthesis protein CapA/YwtB (metallophosphatase superfamily)